MILKNHEAKSSIRAYRTKIMSDKTIRNKAFSMIKDGKLPAARVGDKVIHTSLKEGGVIGGVLGGLAAGPAGVAGMFANKVNPLGMLGAAVGAEMAGIGQILTGSENVFINGQAAAKLASIAFCDKCKEGRLIIEGSSTVSINGLPAAKAYCRIECQGHILKECSPNVFIGGSIVTEIDIKSTLGDKAEKLAKAIKYAKYLKKAITLKDYLKK